MKIKTSKSNSFETSHFQIFENKKSISIFEEFHKQYFPNRFQNFDYNILEIPIFMGYISLYESSRRKPGWWLTAGSKHNTGA